MELQQAEKGVIIFCIVRISIPACVSQNAPDFRFDIMLLLRQALQVGAYTVSEKSVTENGVSILNNFKRPVLLVLDFSLALYILY